MQRSWWSENDICSWFLWHGFICKYYSWHAFTFDNCLNFFRCIKEMYINVCFFFQGFSHKCNSTFLIHQVTGNFAWLKAALQSIRVQCQVELERNSSLWVGSPAAPPESYTDTFCIAGCGGAGTCTDGVYEFVAFTNKRFWETWNLKKKWAGT